MVTLADAPEASCQEARAASSFVPCEPLRSLPVAALRTDSGGPDSDLDPDPARVRRPDHHRNPGARAAPPAHQVDGAIPAKVASSSATWLHGKPPPRQPDVSAEAARGLVAQWKGPVDVRMHVHGKSKQQAVHLAHAGSLPTQAPRRPRARSERELRVGVLPGERECLIKARDDFVATKSWDGDDRRYPQPAEEPDADADAVVIAVDALVDSAPWMHLQETSNAKPHLQHSRAMEKSPLLRSMSATSTELSCEVEPDVRSEFRRLCALSWPVILTYVLEYLPGIIGLTLVGHMNSPNTDEYVDAVALSTMFVNLTAIALGFGLATALDTLCSQAFGAGKMMKLGIYFQTGVVVLGLSLIPVFLLNWYTEECLLLMRQPPEVAALAGRFSRLVLPGIPFLYVYELFKKVLQAQNVVRPMVYIAIASNIVNVVLGVYLTWYTTLGFDGAAIARTVSNIILPIALVPYLFDKTLGLEPWWPGWQLRKAIACLPEFLAFGVPGMVMVLLEWWAFEIMQIVVGWLPNSIMALSVHSVLANLSTTTFNFFFGISVATNICVGNYVGSGQPSHAKMVSFLGIGLSLGVSLVLTVLILVVRQSVPELFLNDMAVVSLAAHALLFLLPYQQLDAINCVMQGVFRGTGRQQIAAYINFFGWFAIGLPAGVYLAFECGYGVEGMWLGLTAGAATAVALSAIKIGYTDWDDVADAARERIE